MEPTYRKFITCDDNAEIAAEGNKEILMVCNKSCIQSKKRVYGGYKENKQGYSFLSSVCKSAIHHGISPDDNDLLTFMQKEGEKRDIFNVSVPLNGVTPETSNVENKTFQIEEIMEEKCPIKDGDDEDESFIQRDLSLLKSKKFNRFFPRFMEKFLDNKENLSGAKFLDSIEDMKHKLGNDKFKD